MLDRPYKHASRKTITSTSEVLHLQAALAVRRYIQLESTTANAAALRMLSWQDRTDTSTRTDASMPTPTKLAPPPSAAEVLNAPPPPSAFRPAAKLSARLAGGNAFNLDARGLPRSPMLSHSCARTPAPVTHETNAVKADHGCAYHRSSSTAALQSPVCQQSSSSQPSSEWYDSLAGSASMAQLPAEELPSPDNALMMCQARPASAPTHVPPRHPGAGVTWAPSPREASGSRPSSPPLPRTQPVHASRFQLRRSASASGRPSASHAASRPSSAAPHSYTRDSAPPRPPSRPVRLPAPRPLTPSMPERTPIVVETRPRSAAALIVVPRYSHAHEETPPFSSMALSGAAPLPEELPPPPAGLPAPPTALARPANVFPSPGQSPPPAAAAPSSAASVVSEYDGESAFASPFEARAAAMALRKLALFHQWTKYPLEAIVARLPRREFKRYELVYREGQAANAFYIILSGAVLLEMNASAGITSAAAAAAAAVAVAPSSSRPGSSRPGSSRPGSSRPGTGRPGSGRPGSSSRSGGSVSGFDAENWQPSSAYPARPLYDAELAEYIGYDVAVYDDATLGAGCVFGVEAMARLEMHPLTERSGYVPRLHTATTAERCVMLVLPHATLRAWGRDGRKLASQLEELGTRPRAELCFVQQALARTPIFATQQHPRLVALAHHFTVRTCEAGERLIEEGKRVDTFYVVLTGRLVVSRRTAWGKMRAAMGTGGLGAWGNASKPSESVVQHVRPDSRVPFVGEKALNAGQSLAAGSAELEDLSTVTVRTAERCCLLCMRSEAAVQFAQDFVTFGELLVQRRQLLMQKSMHAVAMQQAIEKHQQDTAHPSQELQDALRLAKKANLQYSGVKLTESRSQPPPHPHSPHAKNRNKAAEQARKAMLHGMDVHSVATRMGLANKPETDVFGPAAAPAEQSSSSRRRSTARRKSSISERAVDVMAGEADASEPGRDTDAPGGRFLEALAALQAAKRVLEVST